jgi:hypothetical protein
MGVQVFVWPHAFICRGYTPRSRIAESSGNSRLTFLLPLSFGENLFNDNLFQTIKKYIPIPK